jgi:hypothetical protein
VAAVESARMSPFSGVMYGVGFPSKYKIEIKHAVWYNVYDNFFLSVPIPAVFVWFTSFALAGVKAPLAVSLDSINRTKLECASLKAKLIEQITL